MSFQTLWSDIVTFFNDNIWNIISFFALLFIGLLVTRIINKATGKILSKSS